MTGPYNPLVKNNAGGLVHYFSVRDYAVPGRLKSTPTLAAGDFNLYGDGVKIGALGTTPTVTPAADYLIKLTLAQSEVNYDNLQVVCHDVSDPPEWEDVTLPWATVSKYWLAPATAGRDLVVDANGLADANMVKAGPTGSGVAQTAGDIIGDTNDIQARLPTALVGGRMDSSVGAYASGQAPLQPTVAGRTLDVDAAGGAEVGSFQNGAITNAAFTAGAIDAAAIAADAGVEIAAAVWDRLTSALTTVGSIGKRLADDIDATISSRLANADYTAPDNASIAAILADTAEMQPKLPTNNIMGSSVKTDKDDEIDAIKGKTDALPTDPADQSVLDGELSAIAASIAALPSDTDNAAAVLAAAYEGIETVAQGLRLIRAAAAGVLSGAATNTIKIRDRANSKDRITATVDADGNRGAVVVDVT